MTLLSLRVCWTLFECFLDFIVIFQTRKENRCLKKDKYMPQIMNKKKNKNKYRKIRMWKKNGQSATSFCSCSLIGGNFGGNTWASWICFDFISLFILVTCLLVPFSFPFFFPFYLSFLFHITSLVGFSFPVILLWKTGRANFFSNIFSFFFIHYKKWRISPFVFWRPGLSILLGGNTCLRTMMRARKGRG